MYRKIIALLLAVCIPFLFCASCSRAEKSVMSISGAEIDREIFAYYFDRVLSEPEAFGLSAEPDPADAVEEAKKLCTRFTAVNTLFSQLGSGFTSAQKLDISNEVNTRWTAFGAHYEKIGVSRSAVSRLCTAEVAEDAICSRLYEQSVGNADPEAGLREYFAQSYVVFSTVCAYFTTTDTVGSEIPMTQAQRDDLIGVFRTRAAAVTDPEAMDSAGEALGSAASSAILLKKGQTGYPDGFFDSILALKDNTAAVLPYDDCVFLVWKYSTAEREEEYAACRSQLIKELCSLEESYAALEQTFEITVDEKEINKFIKNADVYGGNNEYNKK